MLTIIFKKKKINNKNKYLLIQDFSLKLYDLSVYETH